MDMCVHQPGSEYAAATIHGASRGILGERADGRDPAPARADVGELPVREGRLSQQELERLGHLGEVGRGSR